MQSGMGCKKKKEETEGATWTSQQMNEALNALKRESFKILRLFGF